MGSRHEARRLAVQALYALDMNRDASVSEASGGAWEEQEGRGADRGFFESLVVGAWEQRDQIDAAIQRVSRRWKLHRLDRVDKSILRLGCHELLHWPETPAPVILNESVELAKEFGSPDSPGFVNGILDRLAHEHRHGELGDPGG